jgi:hypothetical protein
MSNLFICTFGLGIVALGCHLALLIGPQAVKGFAERFPRNVWAGRILSAIALLWAAYEVQNHMPMSGLEAYKVHLWWIAPIIIWLTWKHLDELLAPRALGGLLLLLPTPLLRGVRLAMGSTPSAVVMSYVAYLLVIKGGILFLAPYTFRRTVAWLYARPRWIRPLAVVGVAFDVGLIVLALVAYR